jgi:hypothetical protein
LGPCERRCRGLRGAKLLGVKLERETGIEPATNSLEGCDSTTELLPPTRSPLRPLAATADKPADFNPSSLLAKASATRQPAVRLWAERSFCWLASRSPPPLRRRPAQLRRAKAGGEGRIRTSEGLGRQIYSLLRLTASLPRPRCCLHVSASMRTSAADGWKRWCLCQELRRSRTLWGIRWSWRRDLNPRPADYKSAALPD